ncbi:Sortase A, LPXTG specific [Lachnospiraceae bacterium TWA4]|nr:Sortase A, LPXTG specific [Lachnospiraceae bacterium TWA4]
MKKLKYILPFFSIILGIGLLVYPWISEYLFKNEVNSVINTYDRKLEDISIMEENKELELAKIYNRQLAESKITLTDPFTQFEKGKSTMDYQSILSFNELGLIGTIDIPKISVHLPIYHGVSDTVLMNGVGHLEKTSFPIGGNSSHCVLTGHTGLNKARLFTDLSELKKGDYFFIQILHQKLAYQVIETSIVEPQDVHKLQIEKERDLVTLLTCYPYGVNTHRLLVLGERMNYQEAVVEEKIQSETNLDSNPSSQWMSSYKKALMLGSIFSLLLIVGLVIGIQWKDKY